MDQFDAHIVSLPSETTSSPPPSSSPAPIAPTEAVSPETLGEIFSEVSDLDEAERSLLSSTSVKSRDLESTGETPYGELDWSVAWQRDDLETATGQALFSRRLDYLLRVVEQNELRPRNFAPLSTSGASPKSAAIPHDVSKPTCNGTPSSTKRNHSESQSPQDAGDVGTRKKRRLSGKRHYGSDELRRRRSTQPPPKGLSGAFRLRYAKGPGSLRRAESLRTDVVPEVDEYAGDHAQVQRIARTLERTPKSVATPIDGYAPTVPTTPTMRATVAQEDRLANIPIVAPPPFELIPRAPLSAEEAAEVRITRLLQTEREYMTADGLQIKEPPSKRPLKRTEDEEERFWMDDTDSCPDENEVETWLAEEEARECRYRVRTCGKGLASPSAAPAPRARTAPASIELGICEALLGECMDWIVAALPSDETETSFVPGDLYDILSTSSEIRFHAGHLFLRYFSLVGHPIVPSGRDEDAEAFESVTWDIAVACLALSVKFHRDVLYPLEIIYAHQYLDLAPHALSFNDLENAQRDVLEALAFHVGSATPGAFMAELWNALPTLRLLIAFDGGWADAQESAWTILCNALLDADLLRYSVSLLTAAAVIEGVLEVLARRYKATKVDGRGRALKKRDDKSLKKAAKKASHGVRLDIQDVLGISGGELAECQTWLGLLEE